MYDFVLDNLFGGVAMAKGTRRTRQSGLVGHLGSRGQAAYEKHKDDEVVYSRGGDLPAGVVGVAQLVDVHFGTYGKETNHAGDYFFYAAGVVVSPETHGGLRVQGLRTSHTEALCDTPESQGKKKTQEDHVSYMLNEFRKLGVEPKDYPNFLQDVEETIAPALVEAAPHFRFRTWSMDGSDFVNHDWQGVCDYDEEEESDGVVDGTAENDGTQVDPEDLEGDDVPLDRAALAALADEGDEDAQAKITELADAVGIDTDDYATWVEVDEAITATEGEEGEEEEEGEGVEEEKEDPEKTEVWRYKRPGTKKLTDYVVMTVSKVNKTVSLKSLDDQKSFKNVPWSKLVNPE